MDYNSCKETLKIFKANGYTLPKKFDDQRPNFPMTVPSHSTVTRLIMPKCCTEAWCWMSCHNQVAGHSWIRAEEMFWLKWFTKTKYAYPVTCEECGATIGECQ